MRHAERMRGARGGVVIFLGDAMMEISEVHRQIELQRGDVVRRASERVVGSTRNVALLVASIVFE